MSEYEEIGSNTGLANGHYRSIKYQSVFHINSKIGISIYHNYFVVFAISIYHPPREQFCSHYMYVFYSECTQIVIFYHLVP